MTPTIYWIDLFCGAGGTSTGIHHAGNNTKVLACVNHDKNAIESHKQNHPDTHHFTEDIRDFAVVEKLKVLVDEIRSADPFAVISIWASLECTNFSKAKGGQARDADSRTLAEHMFMYLEAIKPDYFWIENVVEFMAWGPLNENGKPISSKSGIDYLKWIDNVKSYGFKHDHRVLNSADFGSYQSRKRLFIQFTREHLPIAWPEQTHSKKTVENGLFPIPKWKAVRDVLDLNDEGKSIFTRKKPLSDKTLDVIGKGIVKAFKEDEQTFLFKYYGNGDNYNSINNPAGTVTTKDRFAKIHLIFNQYKTGNVSSVDKPIGTVTTYPKQNILTFILNPSHGGHTSSIDKPSPTIIARQDKSPLYIIKVLMEEYGIADIRMRMVKIPELKQIQGFPKYYKLIGTQTEQKKYIGNAVEVNQAKALVTANYNAIVEHFKNMAA